MLKDKVSHPLIHFFQYAKDLLDNVRANYLEDDVSAKDPIMFLYTDGSPDHGTT